MRTWRTTLLASAAALALTAGSGFAQGTTPDHGGTAGTAGAAEQHGGSAAQPHAAQTPGAPGGAMKPGGGAANNAASPASKTERNAQGTNERGSTVQQGAQRTEPDGNARNKTDEQNKNRAQQKQNGPATDNRAEKQNRENTRGTAQEQRPSNERNATTQPRGGNNAAEQLERNGRLQGNASGTSVQLNDQQRSEIRSTVIGKSGAPRVGHVDFDVTVGKAVPRGRIHVVPVPDMLVRIEPQWRGFMYFVYEDEIVVVDPHDYRIVAVLPV